MSALADSSKRWHIVLRCTICGPLGLLYYLTKDKLLLIHWKLSEFPTWLTREMLIWLENSTQSISNSEDFHYLNWMLVADYPGHVTTYFRTQCQRSVVLKDLTCDIEHSMKIKYPYTKPQSPTPFNSNSHTSHFRTKLWSKTLTPKTCVCSLLNMWFELKTVCKFRKKMLVF